MSSLEKIGTKYFSKEKINASDFFLFLFIRSLTSLGSAPQSCPTHRIKKQLSICQSSLCLDLVSFPVLSQIRLQAPFLVVH